VLDALLDLLLPTACVGCGGTGAWCPACRAELAAAAVRPLGRTCPDPTPVGFPPTASAAAYAGAIRGALLAHKERGRLSLGAPLGGALAAAVRCLAPTGPVLLVPVPSSRRAVRARGHDHALRLAAAAARALTGQGIPARAAAALELRRAVGDSARLAAGARAANLAGAMQVRPGRTPSGLVVLVDDVVTTGSSLTEAARALVAAGAQVHGAATVAATARRRGRPGPTGSVQRAV